ncbi:MAG: hypothetical protein AB1427_12890 [Thermodesulfobacteriota bacterium]
MVRFLKAGGSDKSKAKVMPCRRRRVGENNNKKYLKLLTAKENIGFFQRETSVSNLIRMAKISEVDLLLIQTG